MPILARVGRRSLKHRLFVGAVYLALTAGAVTMLYPLLLMIAGSSKSGVDRSEMRLLPGFLTDDRALYAKYVEGLFNENLEALKSIYDVDAPAFARVDPPEAVNDRLVREWESFICHPDLPHYLYTIGFLRTPDSRGTQPAALRAFKRLLGGRYGSDAAQINAALSTQFDDWSTIDIRPEDYRLRRNLPGQQPLDHLLHEFKASRPMAQRLYFTLEGFYRNVFLKSQYTRDIVAYNRVHGTHYTAYDDIRLPRSAPTNPKERADWELFARTIVNLLWIQADPAAAGPYQAYLRAKYQHLATLNERYGSGYADFGEVPLPQAGVMAGITLSDWNAFVQGWRNPDTGQLHALPLESIRLASVDFLFRDHLRGRFGDVRSLNRAVGSNYQDFEDVAPPQAQWHYQAFVAKKSELRWEFLTRNFKSVVDYVLLHGRGAVNTAIYCVLAVLAALIVNPLAAYALSRYRPRSTYKVLLFLMLTMAFPPMVTQIPVFLMLRDFGLLNSFWALVLPGLANGYSIFLLKGFFDSLPQELYESASLDGAGEFRIFWQITMSLSKPILAVIALNTFLLAYSSFMFALLICQDQKMWTMMVWLYQLQSRSSSGVVYASLLLAAIPTLIVFMLAQKVIMRGIVVPVEK